MASETLPLSEPFQLENAFADKSERTRYRDTIFSASYTKANLIILFLWSDT
jgi:hypothetical protein